MQRRIVFGFTGFFLVCLVVLTGTIFYYRANYPLKYREIILENCEKYNLSPAFVASVINAESGYDKYAGSRAGALGLMQLLPSTAAYMAEKLNEPFKTEDLFDERVNIKLGCRYLRYLFDKFGSSPLTLAAYNAGEGTVQRWLKDTNLSNGRELTFIPYKETENYVQRVSKGEEVYKRLLKVY